ncbi:MAG: twin-arginine translocation signal domain-containing protein [Pelagibacteraceae bacterium]
MRVLNKKAISRRSFLKGSTVTALGLSIMGPVVFGKNNAWSATFKNLSAEDGATLIQMARDIYPHDNLADKYYAAVVSGYDKTAGKDKAFKGMVEKELKKINSASKKKYKNNYRMINRELERVDILKKNTKSPLFAKVRGDLVVGLYNNKEVWPKFGYEGESASKGGYLNRGFNDIDWLDKV